MSEIQEMARQLLIYRELSHALSESLEECLRISELEASQVGPGRIRASTSRAKASLSMAKISLETSSGKAVARRAYEISGYDRDPNAQG